MALDHDIERVATVAALQAVDTAFGGLGRVVLCLDDGFCVLHASERLDALVGAGAAEAATGRPVAELLGDELFGESGSLRGPLAEGERREGWRAYLRGRDGRSQLSSLSAAPLDLPPEHPCHAMVRYLVVVRPETEAGPVAAGGPASCAGLVARSPQMLKLFELVDHLSQSEATVLLTGESGTGKEVVARAIHRTSPRANGPFVAVNCGALPADLLESELFGHVRGAFTGAVRDRVGRFELADTGTLFLDEVGDLPLPLQVKLLRVLQEGTFERVGESTTRHSGARILAATNQNLKEAVLRGRFRDDLYYRLRVVPIELPPLRRRREDIAPLAHELLDRIGRRQGRLLRLSPDAMRRLLLHAWPGNVRELENALEFAVAICQGQTVLPEHLPDGLADAGSTGTASSVGVEPHITAEGFPERESLRAALNAHQWRRAATARALGISRTTLWRRMRELGLDA